MARLLRRTLVLFLLLGAFTQAPLSPRLNEAVAETPPAQKPAHDLTALRIFSRVILYVKDNYEAPERIKPKEMLIAALEGMVRAVPGLRVKADASTGRLVVSMGGKTRDFDISHVDSLWKMSFTMKDIVGFISQHMRPLEVTREVEYAAVNGMLSTLGPNNVLIRPEQYSELKKASKGKYGSIGVVLEKKEGFLTVVRVLPEHPAAKAGLQKGDRIQKIGEESTMSMDAEEATSKVRGPVDSDVTLTVERQGWDAPRVMTLSGSVISVTNVRHELLERGVGYVRLSHFHQGRTAEELRTALQKLRQEAGPEGLEGVVLDLRGNPGGLLEQAIQVADLFVSEGNLVTIVGLGGKLREVKSASPGEGEQTYPLAVLVDVGTASGAEIVTDALKNLNRAVIIGRRTYGMGTVHVLYDFPDDSALKLAIARYLTPGDVSIAEVGIVPDIELQPVRVTRERVALVPREYPAMVVEFGQPVPVRSPANGKPAERFEYFVTDAREESQDAEDLEALQEDAEVLFARDFLLKAPDVDRRMMLRKGKDFVEQRRREEAQRIQAAMTALGLDWSPGPTPNKPELTVTLKPGADRKWVAGEPLELEVVVENKGTEPVTRLHAWTECPDNGFLNGREFLFGRVGPGEKKSWKVSFPLPMDLSSRSDVVTVRLGDDSGVLPQSLTTELDFVERPRPAFAFRWQVRDSCEACNGDGLVERGETVDVRVDLTNTGSGKATNVRAQLRNLSGEELLITEDLATLGELAPGGTATARFQLKVKEGYTPDTLALKLFILGAPLKELATVKWSLPVRREAPEVKKHEAVVRLGEKTELFVAPEEGAPLLGRLPKGAVVRQVASVGGFAKVRLAEDHFAFVKEQDAKGDPKRKLKPAPVKSLEPAPGRALPRLVFNGVDTSQGGLVTSEERFTLSGSASFVEGGPVELYVLVNDQKVFFQRPSPSSGGQARLEFSADLALKEGLNRVQVVVLEGTDPAIRETLVIRRRP